MTDSLPVPSGTDPLDSDDADRDCGELEVFTQDEGIVVMGADDLVEAYVARIRDEAGIDVRGRDLNPSDVAGVVSAASGIGAAASQRGMFVKLSPRSVGLLQKYKTVPVGNGYNRMTVVGNSQKFAGQLQWRKVPMGPQQLMAVQTIALQLALTSAIAQVEKAVQRVEDKVDDLLVRTKAAEIGDVVARYAVLKRMTDEAAEHGTLPTTDWESVATMGPELEIGIEKLRTYLAMNIRKLDANLPLSERKVRVTNAVDIAQLGESLQLLTVAEQSLFLWQNLRLRRVVESDPANRERVYQSVRNVLKHHAELDHTLWEDAKKRLDGFGKIEPLDLVKVWKVDRFKRDLASLQGSVDEFAKAREMQLADWSTHHEPGYRDTAEAIGELVSETWQEGIQASGRGFAQLSGRMRSMFDDKVVDPLADKVEARVRDRARRSDGSDSED